MVDCPFSLATWEGRAYHLAVQPGTWQHLRELHLNKVGLATLPACIFQLPALELANVQWCSQLGIEYGDDSLMAEASEAPGWSRGSLPASSTKLVLHIHYCSRLLAPPRLLTQLSKLRELRIEDDEQLSELPDALPTTLAELTLRSCLKLRGLPTGFGRLSQLTRLVLDSVGFEREPPTVLWSLMALRHLTLSHFGVKELPEQIGQLSGLLCLKLPFCEASCLPESLARLSQLVFLSLFGCHRLERLPDSLTKMRSLRFLEVTAPMATTFDAELGALPWVQVTERGVWENRFGEI